MKAVMGTLALCMGLCGMASAQGADPLSGTWKLNVAKSDMRGPMASSSEIIVFKVEGDQESFTANAVAANNGEKETTTYTATYGGPDAPMKSVYVTTDGKERVENLTVAVVRISDHVRERHVKRDGKLTMRARRIISDDGRQLTGQVLGTDADGKEVVRQTRVFDRQ